MSIYHYTHKDFVHETKWSKDNGVKSISNFDTKLQNSWREKNDAGYFHYKLKIDKAQILPGKFKFFAQLNLDRALNRRRPAEIQSMKQAFDPSSFNFTKLDKREIIFEIINKDRNKSGNYLVINVSPLEFGNCLFLPSLYSCLPQVITLDSLVEATEILLLSASPAFRVGFNGLCAFSSLNHLHYHTYYLDIQMPLETIEVEHFSGPCYTLTAFPSKGFVFQLKVGEDPVILARNVYKLTNFLQESEEPHNLYMTRSIPFDQKTDDLRRNYIRVYVWARTPMYGSKSLTTLHPALCELFGHLAVKTEGGYNSLTEEYISSLLEDITSEPFNRVLPKVKSLYT